MLGRPVSPSLQMQQRRRLAHSRLLARSRRRFEPLEGKLDGQGHLVIWQPTRYMVNIPPSHSCMLAPTNRQTDRQMATVPNENQMHVCPVPQ